MPELKTNRGTVNEWFYGQWCLVKAEWYAMRKWKPVDEYRTKEGTLCRVEVDGKVFYEYGE